MGLLSVVSAAAIGASGGALGGWRSLRTGTGVKELAISGLVLACIGAAVLFYLSMLFTLLGEDPISFLTPTVFASRTGDRTLAMIALAFAGVGILVSSGIAKVASRGKA